MATASTVESSRKRIATLFVGLVLILLLAAAFILCSAQTAYARTVTSETAHLSEPLADIADYGKPVVAPAFTLESSDLSVRTDTNYSYWIRLGEGGSAVTDPTFGAGTYAYRVCIEAADGTIDFDASSTKLDVDGITWTRMTDFYDSEAGVYCCIYQSPSIEISGQWPAPKALLKPSSGERFALWTKVEGATSYDLIISNTDQLYPRTMTINVTSGFDWHEHDSYHHQDYDQWIDLTYKLPDITVRSGHNVYTLQVIAKGPGKADSEPSNVSTYGYVVDKVLDNVNIDANGKLTWDPYTNATDPEAKTYHVNIYRPDGSFLLDVWHDNDHTSLDLELYIEKYGRVNGKYRIEVDGWDARDIYGGKKLTGTLLRFYEYTPKIKTISIDGLTQPREGELAQIYLGDLSVAEEHVYLPKDGDGYGYWVYKSGPVWPSMLPTDKFEATGTYRASIPIFYDKDYALANNVTVTVNGQEVAAEIEPIGDVGKYHAARVNCPMSVILNNSNTYVVTAGSLNVRADASTSSDRLGGMSYGDVVEAKGQMSGFIQIEFEGQTAWVAAKYLALTYSKEAAIEPITYTVEYGAVNVRSAPDASADNRIGGYTNGKQFLATGRVTDGNGDIWVVVDYNDGTGSQLGFVMEKYLRSDHTPTGSLPAYTSAEEDTDDTDLEVDTGVDAKISFSWKSLKPKITEGDTVSLGEENFESEGGYLIATIYPDDATNFTNLTAANVKLPTSLTDGGYEVTDLATNADGSITLKIGPKEPVTVAFEANDGSATTMTDVPKGSEASEPAEPARTGFEFDGWYSDAACTTAYDFETPVTASITLYAKWAEVEYAFSVGEDGAWMQGDPGGYELIVNRNLKDGKTFGLFENIEIDGAVVDPSNYTAAAGSLDVTFKAAYLETLSVGEHAVKVNFEDGSAETKLAIAQAATVDESDSSSTPGESTEPARQVAPATGDASDVAIGSLCALAAASFAVLIGCALARRRHGLQ